MQFGVSESIYHWGKYRPSSIAVYSGEIIITYSELNKRINSLCKQLKSNLDGDKIGLGINNKLNLLIALVAVLRLNKSNVFLNIGLPIDSLKVNIKDTSIKTLIYDEPCAFISSLMPTESRNINIDRIDLSDSYDYYPNHNSQNDDPWGVLFSSGTTGIPKGIARNQYSMVTEHIGWCLELGLNRNTKFYLGRPLFYTGGLVLSLSSLLVGGSIILNNFSDDNNFEEIWSDYQQTLKNLQDIDWAFFVPEQLRKFCELAKISKEVESSVNILTMGAKISGEEKVRANSLLKSNIVESWGNSESLGTITDPEDLTLRPNSIGRPFLTDEMCIVDFKSNEVIREPNIVGRIAGSDEAAFSHYVNRPKDTEEVIKNNKIISEDLGYCDEDGYFYIKSRIQDSIIRGEKTIYIDEVEEKLRNKLNLKEFCIDIRVDEINSKLILFINNSELIGFSKEEFLTKCNKELLVYEKLDLLISLEDMKKTSSGKIDKAAIKKITSEK